MRVVYLPGVALVAAALGLAFVQPPDVALRVYADRVYPVFQGWMTSVSNRTPIPLFDLTCALVIAGLVLLWGRTLMQARRPRHRWSHVGRAVVVTVVVAASLYVWFTAAWGWHYRRPGVDAVLVAFDRDAATPGAVRALAERAVREATELYTPAHARGFPQAGEVPEALLASFRSVEQRLGRAGQLTPSRPKRPLTAPYMRAVGVTGMLAPFYLETYLNPDITGPERPYVLAHEWAHLAGYAPEEDASFVGTAAALGADVASRYSAWLFLLMESVSRLHPATRALVWPALGEGPRRDLEAIAARDALRVRWLDRASWVVYDRAIKSQGAESGVAGYGRVIELVLGSGWLDEEHR